MDSAILNWACRKLLPRLYIWTNFHARCQRCNRFHTLWQHVDPFFQIGEPLVALKHELSSSFQTIHVPSSCTRNGNLGKIIPSFSANESFATRSIALESLVERRGLYKSDDDSQVYHVRGGLHCAYLRSYSPELNPLEQFGQSSKAKLSVTGSWKRKHS